MRCLQCIELASEPGNLVIHEIHVPVVCAFLRFEPAGVIGDEVASLISCKAEPPFIGMLVIGTRGAA